MRVENDDVDVGACLHTVDSGRTGVATGGAHDGDALAPLTEHMIEQPAHQLQGHIFERKGGAPEQLLNPLPMAHLHQRHHGVVTECGIGLEA